MSLVKNSTYNLIGFIVPMIVAIPALGILSRLLGLEKFGLFTLIFAIIGYASILDLGFTRAVVREIAINRDNQIELKKILSTSTCVMFFLSIGISIIFLYNIPNILDLLNVSENSYADAKDAFFYLSFSIPLTFINQIWIACLEGNENFANITLQKIISGCCLSLFPIIFCLYSTSLTSAVLGILIGRIISLCISFFYCRRVILSSKLYFYKNVFKRLISFGGWLTISNIISPMMVYFDRFIVANILGSHQVALYTAPAEGISKATHIPFSLARALFPKLSSLKNINDGKKLEKQSYLMMVSICFPMVLFVGLLAQHIMVLWMGPEFGGDDATVLRILLVGFFFNSLAMIPFTKLQAVGKVKLITFIHLAEIIPFFIVLYFLIQYMGIIGAAVGWSFRMISDFFIMFLFSKKFVSK